MPSSLREYSVIRNRILMVMASIIIIALVVIGLSVWMLSNINQLESVHNDYHMQSNRLATQISLELNSLETNLKIRQIAGIYQADDTSENRFNRGSLERENTSRLYIIMDLVDRLEALQDTYQDPDYSSLIARLTAARNDLYAAALASLSYEYYQQSSLSNAQTAAMQLAQLHDIADRALALEISQITNQNFMIFLTVLLILMLAGLFVIQWNLGSIKNLVADRAETYELLRQNESLVRGIFASTSDGIVTFDEDGIIRSSNLAASTMFGFDKARLEGVSINSLVERTQTSSASESQSFFSELDDEKGFGKHYDLIGIRRNGESFPMNVSVAKMEANGSSLYNVFVRDLTTSREAEQERKMLEQQLHHAQKMESIGVLAGGIAHDFNNLLVSVIGYANLAEKKLPPESPAFEAIKEIEKASSKASDLCNQLLAYSGKGKFTLKQLNLNNLVEEVEKLIRITVSKRISMEFELESSLSSVKADETQLSQILLNLVVNAADAIGDDEGEIQIATGHTFLDQNSIQKIAHAEDMQVGDYVFVEVRDNGCGMDSDSLERIFEPFFTTKFTGRGLGLSAVLGIVKGHHGGIEAQSTVGEGSLFRIYLPVAGHTIERELEGASVSVSNNKTDGKVLLVDDEQSVRTVGVLLLESLGFDSLTAEDGRQAVDTYREKHDDISFIVLDLTMPNMGGEEALLELQKIDSGVRVIVTSGFTEHEVSQSISTAPNTVFLQKPYRLADLEEKISSLIG